MTIQVELTGEMIEALTLGGMSLTDIGRLSGSRAPAIRKILDEHKVTKIPRKQVEEIKIDLLPSVKGLAMRSMKQAGIETIGDIETYSDRDLCALRGVWHDGLRRIREDIRKIREVQGQPLEQEALIRRLREKLSECRAETADAVEQRSASNNKMVMLQGTIHILEAQRDVLKEALIFSGNSRRMIIYIEGIKNAMLAAEERKQVAIHGILKNALDEANKVEEEPKE